MRHKAEIRKDYPENFKRAAVQFLTRTGQTVDHVAAELGLCSADLRDWNRKFSTLSPRKTESAAASLKAKNHALELQILSLKTEWDILKTTLRLLCPAVPTGRVSFDFEANLN
jgi:transposase-like protein